MDGLISYQEPNTWNRIARTQWPTGMRGTYRRADAEMAWRNRDKLSTAIES